MADVTVHVVHQTQARSGRESHPVADTVEVFRGALVGLQAGFVNHWADGANDAFLGIVIGGDSTAVTANPGQIIGDTSETPDPEAHINTEGVILQHLTSVLDTTAAITQANVGDHVYCGTSNVDDMELNTTGNTSPIGVLVRFVSTTDMDVKLLTPTEFLSQVLA